MSFRLLMMAFGFASLWFSSSFAGEYHLRFMSDASSLDAGVIWDLAADTQEPVLKQRMNNRGKIEYFVELKGLYSDRNGTLLFLGKKVALDLAGNFAIRVKIESGEEKVPLVVVDPAGKIYRPAVSLSFPDWKIFLPRPKPTRQY